MFKRRMLRSLLATIMLAVTAVFLSGCQGNFIVLDPQGPVGQNELKLIKLSVLLCAIVVIPVLGLLVFIVFRYRDKPGNRAPYKPEWADSKLLETIWWGIPIVIIAILGVFTVKGTYALVKPPVQNATPLTIQVTSLDWKWLFQYPDQQIATVNYCEIPAGVPIQFVLTSDAPMNSFWVPQLGGQEYTMPGMAMRLWLQADKPGNYFGSGANFSGEGFAHMQFRVEAKPQTDFNDWVQQVKKSDQSLTNDGYAQLVKPGLSEEQSFASYPAGLFDETVNKNGGKYYMHPKGGSTDGNSGQTDTSHMNMSMDMGKSK